MMKKIALITAFFILSAYAMAFSETDIKAEVDILSITQDQTLTYKLVITSTDKSIPEPTVPDFAGFTVISQAQSSTVSLVESKVKSVLVYVYILAAQYTGEFKIKPSRIKVRGKVISTQEFQINVKPGKIEPSPGPQESPASPEVPESGQPQITL